MCGFVALLRLDGAPADEARVRYMTESLQHRGPDGLTTMADRSLAMGHQRLAIFDLSPTGVQPMRSASGRWTIVYNGALYDYQERRRDLEQRGVIFRGTSDTEVLVNAIEADGIESIAGMNGMFAFAAWDAAQGMLHLVRDRYGQKPLYYWCDGRTFIAASEMKAILRHPDVRRDVDLDALKEYFTFQNLFRYHTLVRGVNLLPPANHATVGPGQRELARRSWWDFDFFSVDEGMGLDDAVDATEAAMERAVARQMVADVRVGSYLSGGIDSGSIAAIGSRHARPLITFTGGFDLSSVSGYESNFDERHAAERIAASLSTEHYERMFYASDIERSLPRLVRHLEDLRMGMSYPGYYMAELAAKFVKVTLSGTGGDELFGGYPWRYYRVFRSLSQEDFFRSYYDFWQRLVPVREHADCFRDDVLAATAAGPEPYEVFRRVFLFGRSARYDSPEDHIANSFFFEAKTFLHGLLVVQDRVSAAHGLEERTPFLDNDLVDLAVRIPVRHKLGDLETMKRLDENDYQKRRKAHALFGDGKRVLRRAARGWLAPEVQEREKQGFSAPEASWYRKGALEYVRKVLVDSPDARYREFISPHFVRRVFDQHASGAANHRLLIWSLLCFEHWCAGLDDGFALDTEAQA